MFPFAIFPAFLFGIAISDPWKCGTATIAIDTTGGKTYYFPIDGVLQPHEFSSPQNCKWTLSVPAGQYAYFSTILILNSKDTFVISSGTTGNYYHETANGDIPRFGNPKFYIPAGEYRIFLDSKSGLVNGSFAFSASLNQLPNKISRTASANTQQTVSLNTLIGEQTQITTNREFSLRTIGDGCGSVNNYFYDACLLFKGENAYTGTFVTGLYNYLGGVPPVLTGTHTLVCFVENSFSSEDRLLITGKPNIPPGATWKVQTGCVDISLVALSADSAYVTDFCTASCTKYLARVDPNILNGVSVDLYSGSVGDEFVYLGSITHSNYITALPQLMPGGSFKTFRVESGSMTIMLTPDQGSWPNASPRSGFIASPNYGITSTNQTFQTSISSKKYYYFSYTVNSIESGKLTIDIDHGSSTFTDSFTNSSQNLKNTVAGYDIKFNYVIGNGASKGMLAHYEISEYNSASNGIFMVLISAVLMMLI